MNSLFAYLAAALAAIFLSFAPVQAADIQLSESKAYITITGGITQFDPMTLADLYNSEGADVYLIVFKNSPGGELGPALDMGREIRRLGLMTATEGYCISACAYMWAAGTARAVHPTDRIGWHSPSLAIRDEETGEADVATAENSTWTQEMINKKNAAGKKLVTEYLEELGYDDSLIGILLAASGYSVVYTDPSSMVFTGLANIMIDDRG